MGAGRTGPTDTEVAPAGAAFFAWRTRGIHACRVLAIVVALGLLVMTPGQVGINTLLRLTPVVILFLFWAGALCTAVVLSETAPARRNRRIRRIFLTAMALLFIVCLPPLALGLWQDAVMYQKVSSSGFRNNSGLLVYGGLLVRLAVSVTAAIVAVRSIRQSLEDSRTNPKRVSETFA